MKINIVQGMVRKMSVKPAAFAILAIQGLRVIDDITDNTGEKFSRVTSPRITAWFCERPTSRHSCTILLKEALQFLVIVVLCVCEESGVSGISGLKSEHYF